MATVEEVRAERLRLHGLIQDRVGRRAMFGPGDKFACQLGAIQQELVMLQTQVCSHEHRTGAYCFDCGALFEGATQSEQIAQVKQRISDWGVWLNDDKLFNQAYPK